MGSEETFQQNKHFNQSFQKKFCAKNLPFISEETYPSSKQNLLQGPMLLKNSSSKPISSTNTLHEPDAFMSCDDSQYLQSKTMPKNTQIFNNPTQSHTQDQKCKVEVNCFKQTNTQNKNENSKGLNKPVSINISSLSKPIEVSLPVKVPKIQVSLKVNQMP